MDEKVKAFVEAADALVNTLATIATDNEGAKRAHRQRLDADYTRYQEARTAIAGDPADEED